MKKIKETLAAPYIGVSVFTLQKWRRIGKGPPFYKAGRCVLYGVDDLDAFLEANKFNSTFKTQDIKSCGLWSFLVDKASAKASLQRF